MLKNLLQNSPLSVVQCTCPRSKFPQRKRGILTLIKVVGQKCLNNYNFLKMCTNHCPLIVRQGCIFFWKIIPPSSENLLLFFLEIRWIGENKLFSGEIKNFGRKVKKFYFFPQIFNNHSLPPPSLLRGVWGGCNS